MRGHEYYTGTLHLYLHILGWIFKERSPQLPILNYLHKLTHFVEKMDHFCKTPAVSQALSLNFSTLHCREAAVYDIRLWQMSPDGTLTLILPHSFFVYFGFMCEQMFSIEKTYSVVEFIL